MIAIERIFPHELEEYSRVSIAFEVSKILRVEWAENGLLGKISEERLPLPYLKDYDLYESPKEWSKIWNLEHWAFFAARNDKREIAGAAAVAFDTPELTMLEGRKDFAVLWDIRVAPAFRGKGIGSRLFQKAVEFASEQGCAFLKIETQNTNVEACKFYGKQGCYLGGIHPKMYADFPDEIQFLWHKKLG